MDSRALGIENTLLNHVRNRAYREDDFKIGTGQLPRIMASLCNLAINVPAKTATPTSPPPSAMRPEATAAP
ncbi:hypothetical protein [Streptomyces sp. TRM68367]|uniref:hypothetical protein n=1 Tax=Streptomyces sp. TRM68367 TaxID=2758415 RepID=UPI0021CE7AB2|nr:hypothetical protein [Streptomyces sp. TRM68367]